MATKLDVSEASGVLVTCSDCPWWFAFAWTIVKGHDVAVDHQDRVHPGTRQAEFTRASFQRRHETHRLAEN